jgi:cell wall-associated NlpC family hydrolase
MTGFLVRTPPPAAREGTTMRRFQRVVAMLLALTLVAAATPAAATRIGDKRAQARRVKDQVDVLQTKAEVATEDWDQARIAYDKVHGQVVKLDAQLKRIKSRTSVLQTSLDTRADSMYRSGPLGLLDVLLGAASFDDFATTWDFLTEQNKREAESVAELKGLKAQKVVAEADLRVTQAEAKTVYDTMSQRRGEILSAENAAKRLLSGVRSEIAALEAADRARRAADARNAGGGGGGTGWNWGNPARAPRSGVVQIALKYLGSPYQWGASGPRRFDCSGFTMFVYAQVGVSLPHSSRAQINSGARVSQSNLRPGDLVFFGSPIHHVGIYIGGGRMVHSPHTGDVVSIDPVMWGEFAGACRP